METKDLIKTFCERLGIQSEAGAEGVYTFAVDAFEFAIHDLVEQGRVALVGDLGGIPEQHPGGLFRLMLEAQYCLRETEGATFAIDSERDCLTLNRMLLTAELDNETFFNEVERFVNQLEAWARIIRDYEGEKATQEMPLDLYNIMV